MVGSRVWSAIEDLIEEIVGEIRDEHDIESPVIQLSDGTMLIDASISLRDLKEDYHIRTSRIS